ncbi:hypothetical protein GCM10022224_098250 [Nonomuraea antimicrobica]|uniref:MmyB-like transcription regulator ligand binding domain-containing protein n=1 Tax=Nonomuraea antimicrobica TaxID=561173 RepID=A0ABP7EEJ5_9ACTN
MSWAFAFDAPWRPGGRPAVPRMFFRDPFTRDLHRNWEKLARIHVAYLRLTVGRLLTDACLAELIGELTMHSDEFAMMWTGRRGRRGRGRRRRLSTLSTTIEDIVAW